MTARRLEQLLDVAADLLVRWGYQRVTIDEVARQAGIGKGTVYLHFRTKDALFLTVLLRANRAVVTAMIERMEADPAEVLPARMMRSLYLDLAADPVLRALYLADGEILGRLAHEAGDTLGDLAAQREKRVREHFELLREAGALRTDLDVAAQLYTLGAIVVGFYFVDSLPGTGAPADAPARAELLEHALASALQVPGADVADVAPAVTALYRSLIEHVDQEWRRRVR